ncbi:Rhodanese-related sulfurtransferase [Rivularia sp. PCC 7116]|uniref:rhodanese-like domain-containing protein n=1 Tax=Rivularia sp. PCC 7116 TaxID=373994 RepID=UPI00029ECCAA|nr:rhodanese-like domain-containing protein [Rivularia sp. PCC 7116]AFY57840.1 Rhodanese-related sulfurtransferase [Rivularia sp. PCC 7116]
MKKIKNICRRFVLLSVLLILCINISACNSSIAGNKQIPATELVEQIKLDKAPIILDVRTPEEYSQGHIPGAINIEYRELPSRISEVNSLSNQKIVVYCERGVRANIAEETLKKAGFTEVLHLEGDMSGWRERGFEVEK